MKLVPMTGQMVVRRDKPKEPTGPRPLAFAEVLAVGPGEYLECGQRREVEAFRGDRVCFASHRGEDITLDGETYAILNHSDILGVIKD